jgi:hypothetical protein
MEPAMNHDHNTYMRRFCRTAAGVAAATGGMILIAIGQLALAPFARADDFTDIVNDEFAIFDAGYADLATAGTDFASADYPDGFAMTFWGLDDFLLSPEDIALIGGLDALTGHPVLTPAAFEFGFNTNPPTDLAEALTDVQGDTTVAGQLFALGAGDFAANDFADGVSQDLAGAEVLLFVNPEVLTIGLADNVLGAL